MRLQLVLLGLVAQLTQVLGVPAAGTSELTAFSSVPADKALTAATGVSDSTNVPDACYLCGSPCGGYYCCDPYPYCGYYTNPFECVCYN